MFGNRRAPSSAMDVYPRNARLAPANPIDLIKSRRFISFSLLCLTRRPYEALRHCVLLLDEVAKLLLLPYNTEGLCADNRDSYSWRLLSCILGLTSSSVIF